MGIAWMELKPQVAAVYVKSYGIGEPVADLIPAMLVTFMESDRNFIRAREARQADKSRQNRSTLSNPSPCAWLLQYGSPAQPVEDLRTDQGCSHRAPLAKYGRPDYAAFNASQVRRA